MFLYYHHMRNINYANQAFGGSSHMHPAWQSATEPLQDLPRGFNPSTLAAVRAQRPQFRHPNKQQIVIHSVRR
jgi:hypothetical protein